MKYYNILIEGCDKVGKSTFIKEFHKLTDFKYVVNDRGIISNIIYSKKFKRDEWNYDLKQQKNTVLVLLEAEDEVIKMRCDFEPKEDYEKIKDDQKSFKEICESLKSNFRELIVFNTSYKINTQIAIQHLKSYMENLNLYESI